jgi:hypothetical protein
MDYLIQVVMKKNIKMLAIALLWAIAALFNPKQSSAQQDNVSFQAFYDALSPYGQWVDYKDYGYVWIPDVGPDFAPYSTDGYWVLTDYGWTWVSDYEWGWAPFHYGRWSYDNYYGWLWVPDNEWGPSWVNWRRADGYYGWSPMEPGISISLSFGRPYNSYNDHWMFVRDKDFERHDIYRYSVNRSDHAMIIRNSTVINTTYIDNSRHTTYVTGPSRGDVQRVTGRNINPVAIQENNRPGKDMNDGNLRMYRPQVAKNNGSERRPAPARVENIKNVKSPSERKGFLQQRDNNQQNNKETRPTQQREAAPADNNGKQRQQNAIPQLNTQPQQQQANPAGKSQRQQQQNATPQKNNVQPQLQQAKPAGNNQRQQQQNATPQKNNVQPQQQKANPAGNNQRQQQQNTTPQKNNVQPQQQKATPAGNNQRQHQQDATPQIKTQPQKQQVNPAGNNQRQQQQNATPQKSNNQPQPVQQQRAAPATNRQNQQQQNVQKQQSQQLKEQEKAKKPEEEKKQNN